MVFRLYFLNDANKIIRREDVECIDDQAAVACAQARKYSQAIEIWEGKRVVATVLPQPGGPGGAEN